MNATWRPKRAHSRECLKSVRLITAEPSCLHIVWHLLIEPSYRLAYIDRAIKSIKGSTSTIKRQTPKHNLMLIDIFSTLE
jgi:hypothetical protein